jgi:hypothetical protein
VIKEQGDQQEARDQLVKWDKLAHQVTGDRKGHKDCQGRMVNLEQQERKVHQVFLVNRVREVQ